ncbi:MAG: T9SS type A sorting domain-containing protein [Gelidibacter sp.]|nr:T9SS type A sorting domain-containing protein [Gelidibacter sp.]
MKKTTLKTTLLTSMFCLIMATTSFAQEMMYEVPLSDQVQFSTQIIEGKVISKKSFWDVNRQNIYTTNTIEVYKVFKGSPLSTIEIVTRGGTVGLEAEIVTPSLQLDINDFGIFTLENNNYNLYDNSSIRFKPYSEAQGFYKYNTYTNAAVNPFKVKRGITAFYDEIEALTNKNYTNISDFDVEQLVTASNANRNVNAITNFSPTTATAGTETVLTINGSGFGATKQNIGFADANDGGGTFVFALASQILSWNDSQITVLIPTRAGTGPIAIINSAGTAIIFQSSSNLNITYSQLNANFDPDDTGTTYGTHAYITQHYNQNTTGGYTWQMHTDFDANTAANASFMRAFDTWRCETGVNWTIGAVSAIDVADDDDVNIIRFDNGAELGVGTLGVCTSRLGGCYTAAQPTNQMQWLITELDIVFNDSTNWQFGPANANGAQIDFETVAVHELGHGHQLGHVIDTNKIMHYAIGGGTNNRTLSASDIAGANDVQSRSTTLMPCNAPVMTNFDCATLSVGDDFALDESIMMYPNPAKNSLSIKNDSYVTLNTAQIYDVRGRLITNVDLDQSRSTKVIDISHLTSGIYLVTLSSNEASITKKLIVE